MRRLLWVGIFACVYIQNTQAQIVIDSIGAKQAIAYLNKIRASPASYANTLGIRELKNIQPKITLKENAILRKVAEQRAMDLAINNYFSHINKNGEGVNILLARAGYPIKESSYKRKNSNYYESLSAGDMSPEEHIDNLIIDEGVEPPLHRNHLLGLSEFWENCTEIGIGLVKAPKTKYGAYMVVIIARPEF